MGLQRIETISKLNKANSQYINNDLYNLLYKEQLYVIAYENIKSNKGAITPAGPGSDTLQKFSNKRIQELILSFKKGTWKPQLGKLIHIPKPGKKETRPLGIQSGSDKVVQEIVRLILAAIYEPNFYKHSYGFRKNRGAHNALEHIKASGTGSKYAINGDIKACFPSIAHKKLIEILNKKIKDQRFLDLIQKMLNAGVWDLETEKIKTFTIGTPQGSVVSPILSNIYLNEMDNWIIKWEKDNTQKEPNQKNKTYSNLTSKISRRYQKIITLKQTSNNLQEIKKTLVEIKDLRKERNTQTPFPVELRTKRLNHTRYADDFIIITNLSKEKTQLLKDKLAQFLTEELHLILSPEKTTITDLHVEKTQFLGYNIDINTSIKITKSKVSNTKVDKPQIVRKTTGHFIRMTVPIDRVIQRLHQKGYCDALGNSTSAKRITAYDHFDIIDHFAAVTRGLLTYYAGVDTTRQLYRIRYIMTYSLAHTLAHKYQSTVRKMILKYGTNFNLTTETINPKTQKTISRMTGLPVNIKTQTWYTTKDIPDPFKHYLGKYTRSNLNKFCAICHSTENLEMHHITSIKNIRPRTFDELHGYVKRKQIPLCAPHHRDVTHGKYDGLPLETLLNSLPHINTLYDRSR